MSPRVVQLEKWSIIFAAVVQVFAMGWWFSTLSETVRRQDQLTSELTIETRALNEKLIRLEGRMVLVEILLERFENENNLQ